MAKQVVKRYNISIPKPYTTAQGENKTQWVNIGTAVMFDDGSILQTINTLPLGGWWDGNCQLFEQQNRQQTQQSSGYSQQRTPAYETAGSYGQQPSGDSFYAGGQQPF
ncbi:MAG: hypothetical protein R3Y50_08790 [Rikenellaceae bacterium]